MFKEWKILKLLILYEMSSSNPSYKGSGSYAEEEA